MQIIAIKDGGVEIFGDAEKIEQKDPSWLEIDGMGNIDGDVFIIFRDR